MKRIYIDNRLNFDYHVSQLYKKSWGKFAYSNSSFQIHEHFTTQTNCKFILMSQFLYCPLTWMCHSRTMEHRINRIHERAVRLFYQNQNQLTFKELLEKKTRPSAYTRQNYKSLQLKFRWLKTGSLLRL